VPQKKSLALILKTQDYGEADRLVVFLTPAEGRVTALAKHARKSKRRFMNCLEPFSLVQLLYTEKPNLDLARLESGELLEAFPELRRDLIPLAVAACLTETAGEIVGAIDNLPELFGALQSSLAQLAAGLPTRSLFLSYLTRILSLAGFGPRWQACQVCGKQADGMVWFSLNKGGIICPPCLGQNRGERLYPLHFGSRKLILAAQRSPLENLARLRYPELAQKEILTILQAFIRFILGKELKSLNFINKIPFLRG
jgi:DNA repair protein RecO (recombination protein O)